MKPYYYVYRYNFSGPTRKHPTFDDAVKESERLAKQHPGVAFEILQCVAITSTPVPEPSTFYLDGVNMRDVESMIETCVPGGDICDPQQVADNLREYAANGELPLPAGLPPLPPVPGGYSRWVYRGMGWDSVIPVVYACMRDGAKSWGHTYGKKAENAGDPYCHYIEAV